MELRQHRDAIADISLTDDEVRLLLGRIGELEFGGSDRATVGAVAEATGKTPEEVARLLEAVRLESFEERFGNRLDDVRYLAEKTAAKVDHLQIPKPPAPTIVYKTVYSTAPAAPAPRAPFVGMDDHEETKADLAPESNTAMDIGQIVSWVIGAVLLVAFLAAIFWALAGGSAHRYDGFDREHRTIFSFPPT